MRPMTQAILMLAASVAIVAVATTGTVYANRSHHVIETAVTAARQPVPARVDTRSITFSSVLPSAADTESGLFIGTGDGNGIWVQQ